MRGTKRSRRMTRIEQERRRSSSAATLLRRQQLGACALCGLLAFAALESGCEADEVGDSAGGGEAGEEGQAPTTGGTSPGGAGGALPGGAAGDSSPVDGGATTGGEEGTGSGGERDGGTHGGAAGAPDDGDTLPCSPALPEWSSPHLLDLYNRDSLWAFAASPCGELVVGVGNDDPGETNRLALVSIGPDGERAWLTEVESQQGVVPGRFTLVAVRTDAGGRVFAVGMESGFPSRLFAAAYTRAGEPEWTYVMVPSSGSVRDADVDGAGNLYVAGTAEGPLPEDLPGSTGWGYVAKLAPDGEHLWTARPDVQRAGVDDGGNSYVIVRMEGGSGADLRSLTGLLKLDSNGQEVWMRSLALPGDYVNEHGFDEMSPKEVTVSDDGTAIYVVASLSSSACPDLRECPQAEVLAKLDAQGEQLWAFVPQTDSDFSDRSVSRVVTNSDGSSLFVQYWPQSLVRYDAPGEPLWTYEAPERLLFNAVAIDGAGKPIVGGSLLTDAGSGDYPTDGYIVRLNLEDGSPL
jgi:hypothetical protein